MKILVINPGSTSTKVAVYHDNERIWQDTARHTPEELAPFEHIGDQLEFRDNAIRKMLNDAGIPEEMDAVIGRGGLLKPLKGGVYAVNDAMLADLRDARQQHACNLGAIVADSLGRMLGCPAYTADPVVVDELMPMARITGLPEMPHVSIFHALNQKAVARRFARNTGQRYEDLNLIVAHLGGGISVGAHRKGQVVDVNNALNGEGPFSPERAGTLPADQLVDLCYSGRYSKDEVKKLLSGRGGLTAHLGTTDMIEISKRYEAGEEPWKSVFEAMAYSVSKEIGSRAIALDGKVDAIILTGGIAHGHQFTDLIVKHVDWIAPVTVIPGEDEMEALAQNALGALNGTLPVLNYE